MLRGRTFSGRVADVLPPDLGSDLGGHDGGLASGLSEGDGLARRCATMGRGHERAQPQRGDRSRGTLSGRASDSDVKIDEARLVRGSTRVVDVPRRSGAGRGQHAEAAQSAVRGPRRSSGLTSRRMTWASGDWPAPPASASAERCAGAGASSGRLRCKRRACRTMYIAMRDVESLRQRSPALASTLAPILLQR